MLKERMRFVRTSVFFFEMVLVSLNFFLIYLFARYFQFFYPLDLIPNVQVVRPPRSLGLYLRVYPFVLLIWAVVLHTRSAYQHLRVQTYLRIIRHHFLSGLIFFFAITSILFVMKFEFVSRLFMIVYTASSVLALIASQIVILSIAKYIRRKGYNFRNILLVGTGQRAVKFMQLIARHAEWGYRIVGVLDKDEEMKGKMVGDCTVIGTLEELPKLLASQVVDEVVFVIPRAWLPEIEKCILYCEAVGVPATLSTDFFDLDIASGVPKEMEGHTYLTFETPLLKESELLVKRFMDIILSSVVLVLTGPLLLAVAIAVKTSSEGPVLFRQTRCGRNGRLFKVYKFRSMVADAEGRLHEVKSLNEMSGPVFKASDDPRLTSIGKWLRKTSLDEFPQFWNVLKGDMSLVGPRPPLPSEVEQYEPWQRRRLSMKPGITCTWQVSGRNQIDFSEWMKLDLQYIDKWSLWLDLAILARTLRAVVTRHGAK